MTTLSPTHTKLLILGSGPAGCTSAIYASRANLHPILLSGSQPGGQLTITSDVENYPGFADPIQGQWLTDQMLQQAKNVGTAVIEATVKTIDLSQRPFTLTTLNNEVYTTDSLILATGATAKWLGLESEKKYQGKGVSGCAVCDAFFYRDLKVIVVGGGDTAAEEALYLTKFASEVVLVHRRGELRAGQVMRDRVLKNEKITTLWNSCILEVLGDGKVVTGVRIGSTLDEKDGEFEMLVDGVFVAIGHSPNTGLVKGQVELDEDGYVKVVKGSTITSVEGVFACGDVQDRVYRQAVTAAGSGCMGALDAERWLEGRKE
jgi:thioredoxin reductase (NADPH)